MQNSTNINIYKEMEPKYISSKYLKLAVNLIHNLRNLRNHLLDGGYNHNPIVR
jgi:hypothetical protein